MAKENRYLTGPYPLTQKCKDDNADQDPVKTQDVLHFSLNKAGNLCIAQGWYNAIPPGYTEISYDDALALRKEWDEE